MRFSFTQLFRQFQIFGLSLMLLGQFAYADPHPSEHKNWSFKSTRLIPVQNGGRIKPLDSFAHEVVLFATGSQKFHGWNSVDLILSWIAAPKFWETQSFIKIGREDVRRQLGLDEKRTSFSPQELFRNSSLLQYADRMGKGVQGSEPPGTPRTSPREQELKSTMDRLNLFHSIVTGQGWLLIPKPAPAAWSSLIDKDPEGGFIRSQFVEFLKAYQNGDQANFERNSQLLRAAVEGEIPHYSEKISYVVSTEVLYNQTRPFGWAWVFYLMAALALISSSAFSSTSASVSAKSSTRTRHRWTARLQKVGMSFLTLAIVSQIFGITLRCIVAGRPPVTNMYESVIWVSLGVVVFALILYAIHRQTVIITVACCLAWLGLIAGDAAPAILDPSLNPLVPVLRSNYWLTVHVLTITLAYAAFALTLGLANITLFHFLRGEKGKTISNLNQLTYRAMQFGVVLIAAGTILGGIWADYSWGRFWGWDPKEVWALITLLCYLIILHGRYTSWISQFGFAAWSAVSFLSVLMAWYGVNFILGAGLHSYGFASGGTPWVLGFVAIQLAYVLGVSWSYFYKKPLKKLL